MNWNHILRWEDHNSLHIRPNQSSSLKLRRMQHWNSIQSHSSSPRMLPGPAASQSRGTPPKNGFDLTGSSSETQNPWNETWRRGLAPWCSGSVVKPDLEGPINTSAISNPNGKCHYATWFGKLQAPIFRQVGFLLEPFSWHWTKPASEFGGTVIVGSLLKRPRFLWEERRKEQQLSVWMLLSFLNLTVFFA